MGCPVFMKMYDISDTFQQFINEYMEAHSISFPTEQAEVEGIAKAVNLPVAYVFIQNACSELYLMFGDDIQVSRTPIPIMAPPIYAPYLYSDELKSDKQSPNRGYVGNRESILDHCSDIGLIFRDESTADRMVRIIQGHNEDWWSGVADKMSVIYTPDWWGYLYPGQLPGTSFVTNRHGLTLSMNSLYPLIPGYTYESAPSNQGVAYVFAYVLRSIVNYTNTNDIESKLSQYPIYSSYSLNVMSACHKTLTNIEAYGDRMNIQHRRESQLGHIGHFNAYINSNVEQDLDGSTSVTRRECELKQTFNQFSDVRSFLGNLSCPIFFTDLNGNHNSETMATWIADPLSNKCYMYRLPATCQPTQSRCYGTANVTEPMEYEWNFECSSN